MNDISFYILVWKSTVVDKKELDAKFGTLKDKWRQHIPHNEYVKHPLSEGVANMLDIYKDDTANNIHYANFIVPERARPTTIAKAIKFIALDFSHELDRPITIYSGYDNGSVTLFNRVFTKEDYPDIPFVKATKPSVRLMTVTDHPLEAIYTGASTCYSDEDPMDIFNRAIGTVDIRGNKDKCRDLIDKCITSRHMSVTEHANFTFVIRCSRATSHQLVRKRIASYSQRSQRYCGVKIMEVIIPPKFDKNVFTRAHFMSAIFDNMVDTIALRELTIDITNDEPPKEDLRYLYHNAAMTEVVMTLNLNSFMGFLNERMCMCAQWEIRGIATDAKALVRDYNHELVRNEVFGPKCDALGYCPEPKKRSCGRKPLKSYFLNRL